MHAATRTVLVCVMTEQQGDPVSPIVHSDGGHAAAVASAKTC